MSRPIAMEGYPYCCPVELRYGDVDAMNHVNNAVYVTLLEQARVKLWHERMAYSGSARDIPFIVAKVAVDYRSPIGLSDSVLIGVGVKAVGRTSFTLAYRIEASGRVAAEGETVQVLFDYARARPIPIEAELRARLEELRLTAH